MAPIPPELTDYIVDYLHDDRRALKACSLTSRTWHPAAKFHLYRKVSLPSFESCQTYQELLEMSPFLGAFTREINVSIPWAPAADRNGDNNHETELHRLWASILPALTTVERLNLSLLTLDGVFTPNLIRNLNTVTEISLQYCRFASFSDFFALLRSFPSLRECLLRGISWNDGSAFADATFLGVEPKRGLMKLKSLTLGRDMSLEDVVQWLIAEEACTELESFAGSCSSERDALLLSEMLRAASDTVKDVSLDWYSSSYNAVHLPFDFTFGSCPSLESLTLRCPIALHSSVPWVTSMLAQVNPARLKTFNLEIRLLGCLTGLEWAGLESRLLREEFAQLTTVEVKVIVWHTATGMPDGIQQALCRLLPVLHSKGMLRVLC